MAIRVAINGFGRIGRLVLRALFESGREQEITVVAINDTGSIDAARLLSEYDSTHGRTPYCVEADKQTLRVNGHTIQFLSQRDPAQLPWRDLNIDVVYECTGAFTSKAKASAHCSAGAKKVLISAPGGDDVDATVVYGVNHQTIKPQHQVISNASCTTNCLATFVKPLQQQIGIEHGLMNTIHAYTNDQCLLDASHSDLRRARAAAMSMIPTKTGAAAAVGLVIPELSGKLDGFAIRVPTHNVSLVDLSFIAKRDTIAQEINEILNQAAQQELKNLLVINALPLVSIDFNHHSASAIVDTALTKVSGRLVKVLAWYDNEWGFSNRMLDTSLVMMRGEYTQ